MGKEENEKRNKEIIIILKKILLPLYSKLDQIDAKIIYPDKNKFPQYYRNEDLKKVFGFSNNTIVKYRQCGILPFTKMGDIYIYDVAAIAKTLKQRSNGEF
jgi:hypothetical protein